MKKTLLLVLAVTAMFNVNAQKKLAYVTDTTTANSPYVRDSLILPMFKADPNFVVTKIQSTVSGQDLSGYDLILISEAPSSASAIMTTLKGIAKPILNMKTFVYKSATGCWYWAATASCVDNASALSVVVNHPGHPILSGINVSKGDTIKMLDKVRFGIGTTTNKGLNGITSFVSVAGGVVDTIAVVKGASTGQLSIFELPVGTVINGATGSTVNAKYIHIGINGASWNNLTSNALKIVKNAAYYLAGLNLGTGIKNPATLFSVSQNSKYILVETAENLCLSIYSVSGQRISQSSGNSISIDNLNKGIYVLKMTDKNGLNQTFKFCR